MSLKRILLAGVLILCVGYAASVPSYGGCDGDGDFYACSVDSDTPFHIETVGCGRESCLDVHEIEWTKCIGSSCEMGTTVFRDSDHIAIWLAGECLCPTAPDYHPCDTDVYGSCTYSYVWSSNATPTSPDAGSATLDTSVPGNYTATCTIIDNAEDPIATADPNQAVTWTIRVRPGAPLVENDTCENSGGSCGTCGDGGAEPGVGLYSATVAASGVDGLPNSGAGRQNTCKRCTYEVSEACDGFYVRLWNSSGTCSRFGPFSFVCGEWGPDGCTSFEPTPFEFTYNGTRFSGSVNSISGLSLTVTYPNGATDTLGSHGFANDGVFVVPIVRRTDSEGNVTTINVNEQGQPVSTVGPNGYTTTYGHDDSNYPTRVTSVTQPDGSHTDISYVPSGEDAAGKIASVVPNDDADAGSYYSYQYWDGGVLVDDSLGRLRSFTQGTKTTTYDYAPDDSQIVVKEVAADDYSVGTLTVFSETVYQYTDTGTEIDTTSITRKHKTDSSQDQTTTYYYYNDSADPGYRHQMQKVVAPDLSETSYEYRTVQESSARTYTQPEWVIDPSGDKTKYEYVDYGTSLPKLWVPPVSAVIRKTSTDTELSREEYTYYYDSSVTPAAPRWQKTVKDVRGNYTYYERNLSDHPELVRSIKVSPPIGGNAPTDTQWAAIEPIKSYTYYSSTVADGMAGQLETETVPDVGGSGQDQVTTYKYGMGSNKWSGSPTQVTYKDASGTDQTNTTIYDGVGRTLKATDASGKSVWYTYDDRGRQVMTVYKWDGDAPEDTDLPLDADPRPEFGPQVFTQNEYSCCGLLWSQDENGNRTYYEYDDAKRITKTWTDISGQGSANPLVAYTYDAFGNQETVTTYSGAGADRITTYTYDKVNRVTEMVCPENVGDEEYGYDDGGRLWWKKDGNDDVTLYQYDMHGRLWNVYYEYTGSLPPPNYNGLTASVTYTYEGNSSLRTSMVENQPGVTLNSYYHYDSQGRLDKYRPPLSRYAISGQPYDGSEVVLYGYGSAGQKTSVKIGRLALGSCPSGTPWYECSLTTDPLVLDVGYDYYANGWLHHVTNGTSNIATFGYDTLGNRTDVDYVNGTHIDYAYSDSDARHMLDSISHMKGATELATIGYTDTARDNAGNPKSMTDWTGTWSYDYDANNRLINATPPNPVPGQPAGGDYGYDWVGNRLNPPAGETNRMQYNSADQLTRWPGMRRYSYDDAGNLIEVKNDAQTATIAGYTYTPAGLLERADFTGHREGAYEARWIKNAWDADSNRVLMEVGREDSTGDVKEYEHSFVYDTTAGIPAVIEESTPGGVVYYIREPEGSLIARVAGTSTHYYHFDALGSTRLLTDGSGTVTDKYSYDAYGALLAHDGSTDQPYQYVGQLGYYTHYQEPDFGLMQLGVRFYDAEVGRFTQHGSPYTYAESSPVSLTAAGGGKTMPAPVKPKPLKPGPAPDPLNPGKILKRKPGLCGKVLRGLGRACLVLSLFLDSETTLGDGTMTPGVRERYRNACIGDCDDQNENDRAYCKARYPGDSTRQKYLRMKCYEVANELLCKCHDKCAQWYPY